jgi:hypothetical protein
MINLQPNLYRYILELTMSARSVTIYQEARTIGMLLLSHINPNNDYESWYEASCWIDGLTNTTLQEFSSFLKESTANSAVPPISVELVRAWRKANLPLRSLPTRQLSPLLIRGLKYLKQASLKFGTLIAQVVTRCLFTYENPVPLALMVLEYVNNDNIRTMPAQVTGLVEFANMIAFHDQCSRSARTALRDQLLKTTFRCSTRPVVGSRPTKRHIQCSKKYFNDHCVALTQQVKNLVLVNGDDVPVPSLLVYLRRILTVALIVSQSPFSLKFKVSLIPFNFLSLLLKSHAIWRCYEHSSFKCLKMVTNFWNVF